jgi:hypothetical protein
MYIFMFLRLQLRVCLLFPVRFKYDLNLSSGSSSTAYTFNGYALARAVAEPPPGLPGRVPGLAASTVYRLECLVVRLGS